MPQETNLNVSPYFDDFNDSENYYKVLFKPGYPIQARELTTLQTILQNQVEQFGKHIFKDGSPVIGGEIDYVSPVSAIIVEPTHNGIRIDEYIDQLIDTNIIGSISGVTAKVIAVLKDFESEKSSFTLYVKYIKGGGNNYENSKFFESENLITESILVNENGFTIQSGQTVFTTSITGGIEYQGSLCTIEEGIFFIRGYFVKCQSQRIVCSQYTPNDTYKVGFNILESIVTSDIDDSLFDNAQGFNNYSAPGADRFSIELQLSVNRYDQINNNFIDLLVIENGQPQYVVNKTIYSLIRDELASRTFDESGDYLVNPFTVFVRDTLNDGYKVNGLYRENQLTPNGNVPSENLLTYQIGPGKAYVGGYDVETISPTMIDIEKPRTTKRSEYKSIPYQAGSLGILNNVYGSPTIGIGATVPLSLMDSRLGESKLVSSGSTIGYARVYDFIPETEYLDDTSRMEVRLIDIDIFTKLTLTSEVTLPKSSIIVGNISNAKGFLKDEVSSSKELILYSVTGSFMDNEPVTINDTDSNKYINRALKYNFSDVKSIYSSTGISTFSGDFVLSNSTKISSSETQFQITKSDSGISTVKSGLSNVFTNILKSGDIISYSNPNFGGVPIYNKVESVSVGGTFFTISGITTVSNICDGKLPSSNIQVSDIIKINSSLDSEDDSLITVLPNINVSSVNLDNNSIYQRRQFSNISVSLSSQITISLTEEDLFFADFDEDNYLISYNDGSLEPLRSQKFLKSGDGKTVTFSNLEKSSGTANIIATLENINPSSIKKNLNKINSIIVDKSIYQFSGIGTTTLNDGLNYNPYYGLRIQDREISLNVPDVLRILAIYESDNISDPVLPKLTLSSFDGSFTSTSDVSVGDIIRGNTSGAVGILVSILDPNNIEYVNLNDITFSNNESITFEESNVRALISDISLGSRNITGNYNFDSGQRNHISDYSRIIRKSGVPQPNKKLKIIYQNYTSNSTDTGEFITVNSYSEYDYSFDIPLVRYDVRSSDVIDLRPRVKPFSLTDRSPFEYDGKQFNVLGKYSSYTLVPNKSLIISYDYYLPRIDIVSLTRDGKFEILKGIPSDYPNPPSLKANTIDIATIILPPYLFDINDAIVNMAMHKRYRMSDISLLEDRIQRLERVTSLNLLESRTESIVIKDAETGLDRFKSGFFADDFTSGVFSNTNDPQFRATIDTNSAILSPSFVTRNLELQLGSELISGFSTSFNPNADSSYLTDLGSPGIKLNDKGKVVTLNYTEVPYVSQQYATNETKISNEPIMYNGLATLSPSEDIWYEDKIIERNTFVEGETTTADTPTVENITKVVNVKGPDIIRYVDTPQTNTTLPPFLHTANRSGSRGIPSSPTNNRRYEGIATGYIPSTNSSGTVNQNAGGFDPSKGSNRPQNAIGAAGLNRAFNDGWSLSQVQDWVNRTGAIVGPEAQKLGLRP